MRTQTHRIFFAVDLPAEIKTKLLTFQDRLITLDANPISAENFHITLSFLGDVSENKIESVLDHLKISSFESFKVKLEYPLFMSQSNILALEVDDGKTELTNLKNSIEKKLQTISHFNIEKRNYKPHVSLFRKVEKIRDDLPSCKLSFTVNSFCLMASLPTKKSVRYEIIEQWQLARERSIKETLIG